MKVNDLIDNFSKERISNIRKLIAKLENKKVSPKLNPKRGFFQDNYNCKKFEKNTKKFEDNFKKNIGIGFTAVGGVVVVTSLFTSLGVKTLVGAAIAGAGIIIILISENK